MNESRALSFGQVADAYDRWRPGYPDAAVDWLAPRSPARVAELGAGTGKLTSLLLARGLEVDVVEADARMLAVLTRLHPGARAHEALASSVPLDDDSVDAVLVADAWHWFDGAETVAEVRRVLRPGGWLGVVWNVVAAPVAPWEQSLLGDDASYDRATKSAEAGVRERFAFAADAELAVATFPWVWEITPEHHAAHVATTSMAIAMGPDERAATLERLVADGQRACESLGRPTLPLRHVASCARWTPAP